MQNQKITCSQHTKREDRNHYGNWLSYICNQLHVGATCFQHKRGKKHNGNRLSYIFNRLHDVGYVFFFLTLKACNRLHLPDNLFFSWTSVFLCIVQVVQWFMMPLQRVIMIHGAFLKSINPCLISKKI